jgi:hypothetical protein
MLNFNFFKHLMILFVLTNISSYDYLIDPAYNIIQVNSYTPGNQDWPYVTELTNGNFIISFQTDTPKTTSPSGNYVDININVYDKSGKLLNTLIPNTQNSDVQSSSCLTSCQDSGFIVIWNDSDKSTFAKILMRKYDSSYNPGNIIQVNTLQPKTIGSASPRIKQLQNGTFIATWNHDYTTYGDNDCYGQLYDTNLNPIGNKFTINQTASGSQIDISVGVLASGGFVAVWISNQAGSNAVYGRLFDLNGSPTNNEFNISTNTGVSNCRTTVTEKGSIIVVWQTGDIWAQKYTSAGIAIGSNFITHQITSNSQNNPSVAALSGGGFVVAYHSWYTYPSWSVYVNVYDEDGKVIGEQDKMVFTDSAENHLAPSVSNLTGVGIVVTCFVQAQTKDEVRAQIFLKDYCSDLKFIKGKTNPIQIDFSTIPASKITITTLPSAGTLNTKANVAITSNSQYSKTDIYFSSNSAVTTSFTYKTNSIDQPCRVDIISCYASCATCDAAGNEVANLCTACDNANSYYPIDSQPTSQCFKSPMNGYYLDKNILYKCYDSCKTCSGAGTASNPNCITCNDNYYPLSDKPALCYKLTELIPGYAFVITDNIFKPCYTTCATCKDIGTQTFNSCTDCATIYAKTVDDTSMCYPKDFPKDGYYFDTTTNLFQKCYYTCKTCTSAGDKTNANCLICADNYPKCNDKCTKFVYNDLCLDTCPVGTISDYVKMTCTTCQTGYYIFNNSCVNKCPDGYKPDASSICQIVNTVNITITNGSTSTTSTTTTTQQSCGVNYLYNGTCVDKCPDGTITVGQICQPQLIVQGILVLI